MLLLRERMLGSDCASATSGHPGSSSLLVPNPLPSLNASTHESSPESDKILRAILRRCCLDSRFVDVSLASNFDLGADFDSDFISRILTLDSPFGSQPSHTLGVVSVLDVQIYTALHDLQT